MKNNTWKEYNISRLNVWIPSCSRINQFRPSRFQRISMSIIENKIYQILLQFQEKTHKKNQILHDHEFLEILLSHNC